MSAETVFKSTHPDVLAAWEDTQRRYAAWHARVGKYSKRFPDHEVLQTSWTNSMHVAGLVGEVSPGAGWRKADRAGRRCWVPDKRTTAGKARHAELEALTVDRLSVLPGMPRASFGLGRCFTHGVDVWDGVVWASWSCPADVIEEIDMGLWERGRLSEFYAAKERAEDD